MMPMYNNSSQPSYMRPQGFGNYPPPSCEHCPTPSPCYGSCIHGNFPVYNNAYWPPCYLPQPPFHPYCMNHPHASHAAPFHAPPCYTPQPFPGCYQQPVYGSEKDVSGKHECAKCSPQMCYPRNERGVVIEEQEAEKEKVNHGETVSHVRPFPWIPYENARIQEHGSSLGSGIHNQRSADVKAPENMQVQKADPRFRNGFFPFDETTMKSLVQNQERQKMQDGKAKEIPFDFTKLKSLLQNLDEKEVNLQKEKEESGKFPYPVFWIPSHAESFENKESSNEGRDLMSFPSGSHVNESQVSQGEVKDENFENKALAAAEEKISMRNIPVVNHLQEPRNIPVTLPENHLPKPTKRIAKNEPVENTKKERCSSSPKSSRLPPVCLRVDPLPKKKNGGSKSLSPPRQKEQTLKPEETKVESPVSSKKAESRTVPEACNVKCEEANKEMKMSEEGETGTEKESVEIDSNLQEGANCEVFKPCVSETMGFREKPVKKNFTEEEAARIIQSGYRGYDVRRWEPLKKLKEIATVREQMGDVTRRIKALEDSSDQHIEEKEIVILGEMVMNLLLKLDSVQGLYPSIRDHRKSLARELSDIQEKLDSLKKSSEEKEAVEEQVKITSETSDCPVSSHNLLAEENKTVSDSNTTEKFLPPSPEEQPTLLMNLADEQLVAKAEEGTGLPETLATDPNPAIETSICKEVATTTATPENIGEVEDVLPIDLLAADGNETVVMKSEEDKVMEEEAPQLVQMMTRGPGSEGLENATGVSEPVAYTSENEEKMEDNDIELPSEKDVELDDPADNETQLLSRDSSSCTRETENVPGVVSEDVANTTENGERKGDNGTELPSEKVVELYELPVEVIDDETQLLSQDPSSETTAMEPETTSQEETNLDYETVANTSEKEEEKRDNDSELPSEKDVELHKLPAQETDDETQLLSRDSSSCTREAETSEIEPETARHEETNVDNSCHDSKIICEEASSEPQEEKEVSPETEVIVKEQAPETVVTEHGMSEETKKLIEENKRFKETMETLVKAGREQLQVISELTGRVNSLEKKLSQNKRTQIGSRKHKRRKHATKPMSESETKGVL